MLALPTFGGLHDQARDQTLAIFNLSSRVSSFSRLSLRQRNKGQHPQRDDNYHDPHRELLAGGLPDGKRSARRTRHVSATLAAVVSSDGEDPQLCRRLDLSSIGA